jgi:alpha-D-ribose 1-methylphosphonate 5-triphosphate synthase subunit PhnG
MAGYRDVMSYSNGCFADFGTDCPVFAGYSDPARTRNGVPLGVPGVSEAVAVLRETLPFMAGDTTCASSSLTLCLQNHRFQVEAQWTADAHTGLGQAISRTTDTGEFWFFAPTNIEVVLKVLDGCALGGHYWVFAGGLTNVAVTIAVTDTQTNTQRIYGNPQGKAFQPIQDTAAFPCQ